MVLFIQYVVLTFEFVDRILRCYHSNETSLAVLSLGDICFSELCKMKFGNFVEFWLWPLLAVKGIAFFVALRNHI